MILEQLLTKFSDTLCFGPVMCCASLMVLAFVLSVAGIPVKIIGAIISHFKKKGEPIVININQVKE